MENAAAINPARLAKLEARAPQNYPPLGSVTKPNLTTAELAYYSNMAAQTWRVKACYDTAPEGLRPLLAQKNCCWGWRMMAAAFYLLLRLRQWMAAK